MITQQLILFIILNLQKTNVLAVNKAGRFDCSEQPVSKFECPYFPDVKDHETITKPIRWLHVPKSGTSFINALVPLGCNKGSIPPWAKIKLNENYIKNNGGPGGDLRDWYGTCFPNIVNKKNTCPHLLLSSYNGHPPLNENEADLKKFSHFTLLRDPVRRMVSLYFNDPKHCQTCKDKEPIEQIASQHIHSKDHSGFAGCNTKMLVGRGCQGPYPTKGEVIEAKRRLKQFTYVGFTDDWANSICKMNQMFNYSTYSSVVSVIRATDYYSDTNVEVERLREASIKGGYFDWADAEVFNFAREYFNFTDTIAAA